VVASGLIEEEHKWLATGPIVGLAFPDIVSEEGVRSVIREMRMGTSRSLPGPRGGTWWSANHRLGCWLSSLERGLAARGPVSGASRATGQSGDDAARDIAGKYLEALACTLRDDREAFGLRGAMLDAGGRLVGALESLRASGPEWLPPVRGDLEERETAFLQTFVYNVAGAGGLITDAAIRQAATACGEQLLIFDGPIRQVISNGESGRGPYISGELFCLVFKLFFKEGRCQPVEATSLSISANTSAGVL